jgi:hypothetical protein
MKAKCCVLVFGISAYFGALASASAQTIEIPSFDIRTYCLKIVSTAQQPVDGLMEACAQQEEWAKHQINKHWNSIPNEIKFQAIQESRIESREAPTGWNYELLEGILERLLNTDWPSIQ